MAFRLVGLILLWSTVAGADEIDFNRDIRPLLANHCLRCHGPDAEAREAGLRLDEFAAATAELDSGAQAIVPGDSESSELVARITSDDDDYRMPPAGPPLEPSTIDLLRKWIQGGADFRQHWSFEPIRRPEFPRVKATADGIDLFVREKLAEFGLTPHEQAERTALIRRVSLALIGLPPTPEEVARFAAHPGPNAYVELVERLLASPRFGERWARVWLDLARYADSAGYAQDPERVIYRYRDWVIDAYNSGMPFDEFTIDQLAGDLRDDPTNAQLLATAFHRNTMTNSEGGTSDEEFRHAAVVDRVNTTMQVWMGLTMGCAQCHDHKYDEITQEEYYQFFAIFNNTADADRGDESPWLEEYTPDQKRQREQFAHKAGRLAQDSDQHKELMKQLASIRGVRTPIFRELQGDQRRATFVHVRGNYQTRGKEVAPGVPGSLHPIKQGPNRLDLSRWLTSQDNPLTARVIVNRCWEQLFGQGLVTTSEDFGTQGELPSHPKLLDYLAAELVAHEWDTKWLLREIVASQTYRQSSQVRPETRELDGSNRWLSRGPRFRLPAEMIRDQALAASGLLSDKMHGPSVRPPRPKLNLRSAFGGSTDWEASEGEDRYRRGLYTSWRRTTPYPSMTTFDAPSREFCTVRRIRTNTPLQALVTLNDPVYIEAAQALARRILGESGDDDPSRIDYGFQLVVSRSPGDEETSRVHRLLQDTRAHFEADRMAAKRMAYDPLPNQDRDRETETEDNDGVVELATWTVVSNVLLNLDETLSPR